MLLHMMNHVLGLNVLHREAKWVKLNRTVVASCKFIDIDEVLDYMLSNKNIIEMKRTRKDCGTSGSDR